MSLRHCFLVLAAIPCFNAAAQSMRAPVAWMAEAQPFTAAAVEQHFGVKVKKRCAGNPGAFACTATGEKLDLRWRADTEGGDAREGNLRLPLEGCLVRREVEEALGTPLRFDANSVADMSPMVTLSARYWTPGRLWRVGMAFDGDCARRLTIATPAF